VRRSVVLVTGMSGTGKSAALEELSRRGHRAVDTDDPGWILEVDTPEGTEPVWDLDRVGELVRGHRDGWLFLAGCVANQRALYDSVDAVVLLSAPLEVVLARVAGRVDVFGATPQDRAKIASDLATYEPRLRAGADHEVVTTVPTAAVADVLERIAAGRRRRGCPA